MHQNESRPDVVVMFDRVLRLAKRGEGEFLEIGRLLRKLQASDPDLFKLAYKQAGIGRRTAYNYMQIIRAFEHLPVKDEDLVVIGPTRAQILAPHVTAENCGELLALAATTSTRDLQICLGGGEPVVGAKAVVLHLSPQDYAHFTKALAAHGAKPEPIGLSKKEVALMNIITVIEELGH